MRRFLACAAAGLIALCADGSASGQSPPPSPTPHPVAKHRHVPVVAPRHAGSPRHAATSKTTSRNSARVAAHGKPPAHAETAAAIPPPVAKPVQKPPAAALPADVGSNTGFHLPRYASLKSDDVNMRVGPAERYPVVWTYKRRELPVRIVREFDIWRLVEDMDGVKGWMNQATLTGRRTFVVTGTEDRALRADASDTAEAVATLKPGVVGRIRSCEAGKSWCQVQVQDFRGWLPRTAFWGADQDEVVAP